MTAALEAFGSGTSSGSLDFSHFSNGVPVETIDSKSLTGAKWGTGLSISSTALIGGVDGGIVESASRTGYDDVVAAGDSEPQDSLPGAPAMASSSVVADPIPTKACQREFGGGGMAECS
jgi:hypothetical protein